MPTPLFVPAYVNEPLLKALGFDVAVLAFYRYLVEHGQDPEYVGVKPIREK